MSFTGKVREKYLDGPVKTSMFVGVLALFIALISLTVALGNTRSGASSGNH